MEKYTCSFCGKSKPRKDSGTTWKYGPEFKKVYLDDLGRKFTGNTCPDCNNIKRKGVWNKKTSDKDRAKLYRKTPKGYIDHTWFNIKQRCEGRQKRTAHIYKGLSFVSKTEFFEWSIKQKKFKVLLSEYKDSNFKRLLAPSIDRINSKHGYTIENMQWITQLENLMKSHKERNHACLIKKKASTNIKEKT